ncbi:MAG: roadblock/LC7 domain-containing protein [Promethearchaeota archaeon]
MKDISQKNKDQLEELKKVLREMRERGELLGVFISHRDGNLILSDMDNNYDSETFSAMGASVIASAETLGYTLKNQKFQRLIAELQERILILNGISDQIFILLIFKDNSNINSILNNFDKYCNIIKNLY